MCPRGTRDHVRPGVLRPRPEQRAATHVSARRSCPSRTSRLTHPNRGIVASLSASARVTCSTLPHWPHRRTVVGRSGSGRTSQRTLKMRPPGFSSHCPSGDQELVPISLRVVIRPRLRTVREKAPSCSRRSAPSPTCPGGWETRSQDAARRTDRALPHLGEPNPRKTRRSSFAEGYFLSHAAKNRPLVASLPPDARERPSPRLDPRRTKACYDSGW